MKVGGTKSDLLVHTIKAFSTNLLPGARPSPSEKAARLRPSTHTRAKKNIHPEINIHEAAQMARNNVKQPPKPRGASEILDRKEAKKLFQGLFRPINGIVFVCRQFSFRSFFPFCLFLPRATSRTLLDIEKFSKKKASECREEKFSCSARPMCVRVGKAGCGGVGEGVGIVRMCWRSRGVVGGFFLRK